MNTAFWNRPDYYAGGLMGLVGAGAVLEGRRYGLGTLAHMGPGFFPIVLGVLLAFLGILIAINAAPDAVHQDALSAVPPFDRRGGLCVIAGVLLFIAFGEYGGLIPATFFSVFVSALGDRTSSIKASLILAVGITLFSIAVFYYGLEMQLPLLSWQQE